MPFSVGDVFRYAGTGPAHNMGLPHAHVVVKVDATSGELYCIPISREPLNWDTSCELELSDRVPSVTQRSFMAYYHAKKSALAGLALQVQHKQCVKLGTVSPSVLQRILDGVVASDECEPWFEEALNPKPVVVRRILRAP